AALGRAATVMGHAGHVLNHGHGQSRRLNRTDRRLATCTRTVDVHTYFLQSDFKSFLARLLSSKLCGEGRALARTGKAYLASARPSDNVSLGIGYRYNRVVKGSLNMCNARGRAERYTLL